MSRFRAAGIHLGLSFLIFLVLAYLIVFTWYPGVFFDTDGGWRGMRIIIGVDLILGPTLTLVAYKAGKPGLKFDLSAIAALQTVCLIAGTWIVWSERPVAVVYVDSRFEVLTSDDYKHLPEKPNLAQFPGPNPKWVMVDIPTDIEAEAEFRKESFRSGVNLAARADRYLAFDPTHPSFTDNPRDIQVILGRDRGQDGLDKWLAKHGGTTEEYAFYTFATRYVYRYLGFDPKTGENLGFLEVQPR
ncbi:MAG: hypothetical protein GKR90_21150 [Pseudomonadales bacterium]|nr:hypothetical protein [Pseudomonadales bacterium]